MKIAFVGTINVGKTTLVNALAELPQFKDYKIATERSKYLRDLGIPLNTDSTLKGQMIFGAERASELFHENLLTDRSIIDVMAFTNLAKSISTFEKQEFEFLYSNIIGDYDYVFYISPEGIEIEDNGVRATDPKYRLEIDNEIKTLLGDYIMSIKNYHEISGSTPERIKQILEIIKASE
jgi:GTPase SAR1 family protein